MEAAGAMATAGLAAGALEGREAREGGDGPCLNCGTQLSGRYCSACGQAAHPHRTLAHVFEEALHGLLHFDTKAWRTLPMVIGRPGTLTRNYVYGQRARYISPLALFLFCIFLMFFVFAFIRIPVESNFNLPDRVEAQQELQDARAELAQAQRDLTQARTLPDPDDAAGDVRSAERNVAQAQADVTRHEQVLAQHEAVEAAAPESAAPQGETWQEEVEMSARSGNFHVDLGSPALNERITHAAENPDLAIYKVQNAAYKFSFLLLPISLPFIWLLFVWKRGLTLYDHAAYALYALSFASLLFIAAVLTVQSNWTSWVTGWLAGLGLPVHTFFHLKGAYALGWFSALWRTVFMLFFAAISLIIFIVAIFVLGLVG